MYLDDFEKHQHKTNKLAKDTLKSICKIFGADYNETLTLFKNGHPQVNRAFWLEFYKQDMARLKNITAFTFVLNAESLKCTLSQMMISVFAFVRRARLAFLQLVAIADN